MTGLASRHQPALLERDDELAALDALIAGAVSGGRVALVEGPPGIGKTQLLVEARRRARGAGLEVLSARAIELEHELAYGVVRQLFEPMLAGLPAGERETLLSGPALPAAAVLDPTRPLDEPGAGNPDASFSTLHALYWVTANVAARRPLLLCIDDLHCCDLPSLRWLAYLLPRMQDLRVVVVAGMRPLGKDAHGCVLGHIAGDTLTTVLHPAPLSEAASCTIVRDELTADADSPFCVACHVESRGNPLWLREMARAVAAEGLAPVAGNVPRLRQLGAKAVSRAVSLRLSRLPDHALALARAVVILGDGADFGLTAALAGLGEDDAFGALLALSAADILDAGPPVGFVHPVVRAAVESEFSPPERDRAHRRAAGLLGDAGAEAERVAAHLLKTRPAGEPGVPGVLREAARAALARGAAESSVAYLARALREPPQEADRTTVLIELGLAESLVDGPAAAGHLAEALDALRHPVQRAEVALMLGRTLYYLTRTDEAIAVFRRALAELPSGDSPLRRLLEAALSHASFTRDGCAVATAHEYAVRHEERPADLGGRWLHAVVAYFDAHAGAGADAAADRAERALSGGVFVDEDNGGGGLAVAALVVMHADRDVRPVLDTSLARAHARGSLFAFAAAKVFRARAYFLRGELEDAEADARDALDACEAWNIGIGPPYAAAYLADALLEQGRLDAAAEAIARGVAGSAAPAFVHTHWLLESRARLRLLRGDLRGGVAELLDVGGEMEALGLYNPAFMPWRSLAAHALLALGEREQARRLAAAELDASRRWGAPRALAISLRAVGLAEGGAAGLEHLEEAVAVVEGSPAQLEHAKALVELGAALRRANRRIDARESLRRGLELATVCGARPLSERAETELLASGARLRRIPGTGADALTPSERRVAELAAGGASNREIAQTLFVTTKTVEVHLSSAYRKLSIGSRAQLAAALRPA